MSKEHSSRSRFWFSGARPWRAAFTAALSLIAVSAGAPLRAEWLYREAPIMGTRCDVELWTEDRAKGEAAIDAVFADMQRFDDAMSTFKPESEVSRVNATAAAGPVKISRELYDLIATSLEYSKITRGTFDITYASVGYLYDYRKHVHPDDAAIAATLPGISYHHVHLDQAASTSIARACASTSAASARATRSTAGSQSCRSWDSSTPW
jgi:FAD:protein FMN transferase